MYTVLGKCKTPDKLSLVSKKGWGWQAFHFLFNINLVMRYSHAGYTFIEPGHMDLRQPYCNTGLVV